MIVTYLRELLEEDISKVYSPDLVQDGQNIGALTLLDGDLTHNTCGTISYKTQSFRVLLRGNASDSQTRALIHKAFNRLHMLENITTGNNLIIQVLCKPPVYVGRDENNNILYNILCEMKYRGEL